MTLLCKMKSGESRSVRVPIEPPLAGYHDVKPRLLEMKSIAQENLGMVRVRLDEREAVLTMCHICRSRLPV